MTESRSEIERLLRARQTLKLVWNTYHTDHAVGDAHDTDVQYALEVALDQIDLALLHNTDAEITFTLEGET